MATFQGQTGNPGQYSNYISGLLSNPSSFQTDPGYQFAFNQGLQAVNRNQSRQLGSGAQQQALMNYGIGTGEQAYDTRLGQLTTLQNNAQNYDLGLGQNSNTATNNANQYALGLGSNANTAQSIANQYALGLGSNANQLQLGLGANANTAQANANNFFSNLYSTDSSNRLGTQANNNAAQNNWFNYQLGQGQNANTAANNYNNYNLGAYNAQTQRGTAMSNANVNNSQNNLDWSKFYNTMFPGQA